MDGSSFFSGSSNPYGLAEIFHFTLILHFYADDSKKYICIQTSPLKSWLISTILNFKRFKGKSLILCIFQVIPRFHHLSFFNLSKWYHKSYFSNSKSLKKNIDIFSYLFLFLSTYFQFLFILYSYILNPNSFLHFHCLFSLSHCLLNIQNGPPFCSSWIKLPSISCLLCKIQPRNMPLHQPDKLSSRK